MTEVSEGHHLVARDGSTVLVRPVTGSDRPALRGLYEALSPESAYARFLGLPPRGDGWFDRFLNIEDVRSCTLVAEAGGDLIGTASYACDQAHMKEAEVAFAVADRWQGRGLGTLMLERLAEQAREAGIERFRAWTRADNQQMLRVFHDAGLPMTTSMDAGLIHATIDLCDTTAFAERHAGRAALAAHESIRPFFEPTGVAVIGASRSRAKVGGRVVHNLRSTGFQGQIYPVNARASEIEGLPAYARVADIAGRVDLAVIAVPAAEVPDLVDQCLARGIKALVILTAGFAEVGADGSAAQEAVLQRVRRAGARLIGPNCMGVINTSPAVRLNATFAPGFPPPGRVSMSTQSGAIGLAVLADAQRLGLGLSTFVSIGNKADVSGNDLIQYWAQDPSTDVILMYTEGFGNPRKFAEIARRTAVTKPVVVLKAGRTQAGLRAASSHTAALAADDAVVDALLHQCGVTRVRTLEEMFDTALAMARAPLPKGKRVAILTNAGGAGILAADACEAAGLTVAPIGGATTSALRAFLPEAASTSNPIDMIASATPQDYARAIPLLLADPDIDSLIATYVPPALSDPIEVAEAIAHAVRASARDKPVLVSFVSAGPPPTSLTGLATYPYPERAAAALARCTAYAEWRRHEPASAAAAPPFDEHALRQRMQQALARGDGWLPPEEVEHVLENVGVPRVRSVTCRTSAEAGAAAEEMGFPVVVKALGPTIVHKSELKAVRMSLADAGAVISACDDLRARLGDRLTGVLVQAQAAEGPEFLVGGTNDPAFGPIVAIGAGGTLADLLRDVTFAIPPLSEHDLSTLFDATRATRLIRGYRGAPIGDERALKDTLVSVAALMRACPEIAELDLNPVRVYERGALVLDARIRLAAPALRRSSRIEY